LSIVGHPSISPAFKNLLPFCSDEWKLGFIVMNEGFVFEFRYKNNKKNDIVGFVFECSFK